MLLFKTNFLKGHVKGARSTLGHMTPNMLHLTLAADSKAVNKLSLSRTSFDLDDESFPTQLFLKKYFSFCVCFRTAANNAEDKSLSRPCWNLIQQKMCFLTNCCKTHFRKLRILCFLTFFAWLFR